MEKTKFLRKSYKQYNVPSNALLIGLALDISLMIKRSIKLDIYGRGVSFDVIKVGESDIKAQIKMHSSKNSISPSLTYDYNNMTENTLMDALSKLVDSIDSSEFHPLYYGVKSRDPFTAYNFASEISYLGISVREPYELLMLKKADTCADMSIEEMLNIYSKAYMLQNLFRVITSMKNSILSNKDNRMIDYDLVAALEYILNSEPIITTNTNNDSSIRVEVRR